MNIEILENEDQVGEFLGKIIIDAVKNNPKIVLGLATGSSPIKTYEYLISDFKKNKTDFSQVIAFNLDEYIGLNENDDQSYKYYMNEQLFNHININKKNTFIPDPKTYLNNASDYDKKIAEYGGIDLQILGIGENGHIGFNEPPTSFDSLTHVVDLTKSTINSNAKFFKNIEDVPKQAISMGLNSIYKAKKIYLIALGEKKQDAIFQLVKGNKTEEWPCTILKDHSNFTLIIDKKAAGRI
ncbi:glucosamine-6-phosphate deaminase [Spiroplasma endosymbiont of Aspidapion aeneum]|uniref:glucosamine-6-phosphate deaminase n=1 Tax=Spiroplasma endosymbiont of Aspidapion aeneum TaxID=3066276 RepID=UPI00313BB6CE